MMVCRPFLVPLCPAQPTPFNFCLSRVDFQLRYWYTELFATPHVVVSIADQELRWAFNPDLLFAAQSTVPVQDASQWDGPSYEALPRLASIPGCSPEYRMYAMRRCKVPVRKGQSIATDQISREKWLKLEFTSVSILRPTDLRRYQFPMRKSGFSSAPPRSCTSTSAVKSTCDLIIRTPHHAIHVHGSAAP